MSNPDTGQPTTLGQRLREARDRKLGSKFFTGITPPGRDQGPDDDGIPGTPNNRPGTLPGRPGNRPPRTRARRGGIGPTRTALSPKA